MEQASISVFSHFPALPAKAKCVAACRLSQNRGARARALRVAPSLLFAIGLSLGPAAAAQSAHFAGVVAGTGSLTPSGFSNPVGMTFDSHGNLYIADNGNTRVVEIPANGGAPVTIGSGFGYVWGVAVDASGDVFVADQSNGDVVEVPTSGPQTVVSSGLSVPSGVAVDGSGNVYIANTGAGTILEVSGVNTTTYATVADPHGLALDGAGNLYAACGPNGVYKIGPGGSPITSIGSGLNSPYGVFADAAGDVYIADSGNNDVVEVPATGPQTTISADLDGPGGVAVDSLGDVYIANSGGNQVLELPARGVNLGTVNVSQTGSAYTLDFIFDSSTNLTSGTPYQVLTGGAVPTHPDFIDAGSATCSGSYSQGQACTVNVEFKPQYAGARNGAVELTTGSGPAAVLATAYLSGTGSAPQIAFSPAVAPATGSPWSESVLAGVSVNTDTPSGVAVDTAGNIYFSDTTNDQVVQIAPGGGTKVVATGAPLAYPDGVAVDGAGNVYIADLGGNQLYVASWNGSSYSLLPLLPANSCSGSTCYPAGVAVDAGGNVYFTSVPPTPTPGPDTHLYEISASGIAAVVQSQAGPAASSAISAISTSLVQPSGVAFDASGNLFVTDSGGYSVWEFTWTGSSWSSAKVISIPAIGSNPSIPAGIAVDASDSLYIADYNLHYVYKYPSTGVNSWGSQFIVPTSKRDTLTGVALDGGGDLYIAECNCDSPYSKSQLLKEDYVDGPTLPQFANTIANSGPSSDSPQTVIVENVGNGATALTGSISTSAYFSLSGSSCTLAALNVLAGGSCNVDISFEPTQVGDFTGTVTVSDNTGNASPSASQTIQVSGDGTYGTVSQLVVTTNAASPDPAGTSFSVTVTAEDEHGNTVADYQGTVAFTSSDTNVNVVLPSNYTFVAGDDGVHTFSGVTLVTAGSQTITATDSGNSVSGFAMVNVSSQVTAASYTVTGIPASVYVTVPQTGTVSAVDTYGNLVSGYSGPATITSSDGSATIQTPVTLASGTATFTIAFATAGTQSVTASGALASGSETGISVNATPAYVVTQSSVDDYPGAAGNCPAGGPSGPSGNNCSLRDALAAALATGTGNITFSPTALTLPATITLTSGYPLAIPAYTSIQGLTSGSGYTLANQITISGSGPSSYPVFTVGAVLGTSIANLNIINGNNTSDAGGIVNQGTLTISSSTISSNVGYSNGGAIDNSGTLAVSDSSFNANFANTVSSTNNGGAINNSGTLTVSNSTFDQNTAAGLGGAIFNTGSLSVNGSTIAANTSTDGALSNEGSTFTVSNSILSSDVGGECSTTSVPCPTNGSNGNVVDPAGTLAKLDVWGNYGGPTNTLLPLPGSAAICAVYPSSAAGTDQRGLPRTTTYSSGPYSGGTCLDAGAVQTNYALAWTTEPGAMQMSGTPFSAAVTLTESGQGVSGVSLQTLVLNGGGTLGGEISSTTGAGGVATYMPTVTSPTMSLSNLTLTAAVAAPPGITANSTDFMVDAVTQLGFVNPPAANIYSGGNAGSAITVAEEFSNSSVDTSAADQITLSVTGPNSYSATYGPVTAVNGVATFNLSSDALPAVSPYATYTYTATAALSPAPTPATATENVYYPYSNPSLSNENVGTTSGPGTYTVVITRSGTLSSINVLTFGQPNLDFTNATGGSCATGTTYAAGQACTVIVSFNPLYPGARYGAVLLEDASNNVLGQLYLDPQGEGPEIAFPPGAPSELIGSSFGLSSPSGDAVDAAGNYYVVDTGNNRVVELPVSGSTYGWPTPIITGLSNPSAMTLDGAGDIFLVENPLPSGPGVVLKVPESCFSASCPLGSLALPTSSVSPAASIANPAGVVVDGNGNVYVSDDATNAVYEIQWNGVNYAFVPTPVVTGLSAPGFMTMDSSGDLIIANNGTESIVEATTNGPGSFNAITTLVSGLTAPVGGVAVDAAGDLYISEGQTVVQSEYNGQTYSPLIPLADVAILATPATTSPSFAPTGVALDGLGNVYIADGGDGSAIKLDEHDPPSLNFAATQVGSTSSDSPQTLPVENIGNQPLNFSSPTPSYPTDFLVSSPYTEPASPLAWPLCATGSPVLAGTSCNLSINFEPTVSGTLNETLYLNDNNLNNANASQSVSLNGDALALPTALVEPSSVSFANQIQGTTSNSWTLTLNNTSSVPLTGIFINIVGTNPSEFAETNTCGAGPGTGPPSSGATLAPNTTCNIMVTFTPPVTADAWDNYSATLQILDNAYGNPQTVPLFGTGIAMTALLSPNWVNFGTQSLNFASPTQTVILANASSGTLNVSNVNIATTSEPAGGGSAFAIVGTTCGALTLPNGGPVSWTLAANTNCTITMAFTPGASGSYTGTLSVTDNGLNSPQTVTLSGQGAGQNVFNSPTYINFGTQTVGSVSNSWTVTFNNTSGEAVTGVGVSIGGANPLEFSETNNCPSTLAAYTNCNIQVSFNPNSANSFTGTLIVNNSVGAQYTYLNGTGTQATSVLAPNQLNFGSQAENTTSGTQVATLTNTSNGPLTLSSFAITLGSADFTLTSTTCSTATPLPSHGTCTFNIVFNPPGVNTYNGTLTVNTNGVPTTLTTALVGVGTSSSSSTPYFSPSFINFGNQTAGSTSQAWGVTLNNPGSGALTGLSLVPAPNNGTFQIINNNCGSSLAGSSSCSFQVTFTPPAPGTGQLTGDIVATYTGGSGSPLMLPLSGTSIAPTIALAPSSLNYGNQAQSTASAAQTLTISNTSSGPITLYNAYVTPNATDFIISATTCGTATGLGSSGVTFAANTTLASGHFCTISVEFDPQTTGSIAAALYVTDSAGNGTQSTTLTGTGTSGTASGYFVPSSINFGNQTVGSTSQAWGMTLNNSGSVTMQSISISASGDFAITNNNCSSTLAAGAACGFQVTFTPSTTGTRGGLVTASFTGGSLTANLTGYGVSTTATLAPNQLNFGNEPVGQTSSAQIATLTNTSAGPITISSITPASNGSPFAISGNPCGTLPAVLPANGYCNIPVTFTPTVANTANGTLTVTFSGAGAPGPLSLSLVGLGQLGTASFTCTPVGPLTYGNALSTIASALSTACTVSTPGVTGTFAFTYPSTVPPVGGADSESVTFNPSTAGYSSSTGTVSVDVTQGLSTAVTVLVACSPNPVNYQTGGSETSTCTATVSGPAGAATPTGNVSFSVNGGPSQLVGLSNGTASLQVTGLAVGTFPVVATYNGDSNYLGGAENNPAASLTVSAASPNLYWAQPGNIVYGTALGGAQLNATASAPGTYNYTYDSDNTPNSAVGAILGVGTHTLKVTFTPTSGNYSTATASVSITVTQATPTLTWATPANITYGTALSATQLDASAGAVAGTYVYSPAAGTILQQGTQTLYVTFTPTDSADYTTASASVNIYVNQATPNLTWSTPANIVYGTALSGTQLDASSNGAPGSFSYNPGAGTVLTAGAHMLTATFYPSNSNDYASGSVQVTITVTPATPTITWSDPSAITYGTPLYLGSPLNASASTSGTFNYTYDSNASPNSAVNAVLGAGAHTLYVAFTPSDATDYNSASANVPLTVNKATPNETLSCSPNPVVFAAGATQTATCTAQLYAVGSGVTPTSPTPNLTFYVSGSPVGSAESLSGGIASVTTFNGLDAGSYSTVATYGGDSNYNSTSQSTTEVISPSGSPGIVTSNYQILTNPSSLTVQAGQSGTAAFSMVPVVGYTGTVTLSCGNLPSGVTCSFAPASLTADGTGAVKSSTLTITTVGLNASAAPGTQGKNGRSGTALAGLLFFPGLLFGGLLAWQRKKLSALAKQMLLAGIVLSTVAGFSGCGGSFYQNTVTGTHAITITATATASASNGSTTSNSGLFTLTITQ